MEHPALTRTTASRLLVTGGTAIADTRLTAFDGALHTADIHNVNLIRLSSIVPAEATVDTESVDFSNIEPGSYVPAVYAFSASETPGDTVYAAVAGCRLDAGYGINVEDHGTNADRSSVQHQCEQMLAEMVDRRDATMSDDCWFHYVSTDVPPDGRWAGAVAAILYQ